MRLLLIRHAPTPETGTILTGRAPGVSLGEAGREMAQHLADRLSALKGHALYSSPIERCRETATPIGRAWGLKPRVNRGFIEVDYGDWTGRKLKQLYKLKAWRGLFVAPSRFRFPRGESLGEMQSRAVAACEDLADSHRNQTVGVVTHADIIRAVLAHYLGSPLDLFQRLDVLPASVSVIDLPRDGWPRVPVVNHVADLERWR